MTNRAAPQPRGYEEFRRGWRPLAAVTIAASFGFPTLAFFSIGIFAPIFAEEFGWSFGAIMAGLFLASFVILVFGPFVGRLIDKRGPRRLTAVSLIGFGLGYMSLALSTGSLVQYFASWALMSVAGLGATAISFTHIISGVFHERRGLALGIALSSSGVSAMLVKPLAGLTIALFGWRETILLIGLMPILLGAPILIWGVSEECGGAGGDAHSGGASDEKREGVTILEVLKERAIWILLVAFTAIAFGNGAPIPNLENILRTHAFGPAEIIEIASLIGAALIIGRVFGGWLIDHFWAPLVGFVLLTCAALGCWVLSYDAISYGNAQIAVILISVAAGVEYDLLSFLVARYLGRRHYGVIYSLIFGVFAISTGVGPVVLGYLYDRHESYALGLLICSLMLFFAGLTLLALGRYPDLSNGAGEKVDSQGEEIEGCHALS